MMCVDDVGGAVWMDARDIRDQRYVLVSARSSPMLTDWVS